MNRDRPFFLWIHLYDPHAPHEPDPKFLPRAKDDPYYAEVAQMDSEIGRFFDLMRAEGVWEDTLIVVVADHGEGRGDHGVPTHGPFAFEETLRVPLIVRDPEATSRHGTRSAENVSVVDVFPTLLEAMSLPPPSGSLAVDSHSLLSGSIPEDRGVYFETYVGYDTYGWSPQAGWIEESRKYVHMSKPVLYDLGTDPKETTDLIDRAESEQQVRRFRDSIAELIDRPSLPRTTVKGDEARLLERLAELGYGGASAQDEELPSPLLPSDRPSSHERVGAFTRFMRQTLVREARFKEAIALLEQVVKENPRNTTALSSLGGALISDGRPADALVPLEQALALVDTVGVHWNLALCHDALGNQEQALPHYFQAITKDPRRVEELEARIETLRGLERDEEADGLERVIEEWKGR